VRERYLRHPQRLAGRTAAVDAAMDPPAADAPPPAPQAPAHASDGPAEGAPAAGVPAAMAVDAPNADSPAAAPGSDGTAGPSLEAELYATAPSYAPTVAALRRLTGGMPTCKEGFAAGPRRGRGCPAACSCWTPT